MAEPYTIDTYHVPVLRDDSIDLMDVHAGGIYVDVTFGGGGHSREILRRLTEAEQAASEADDKPEGHLFSFDQDADAERNIYAEGDDATPCLADAGLFTFVRSNFRYLKNWMRYYDVDGVDAILADLGVSSHHFDDETRGFSFRYDSPLDMRMNNRAGMTAADVLRDYSEEQLADIFYLYGELKQARRLAQKIVKERTTPIETTGQLASLCEGLFPKERAKKELTKVFQALRIEVNHEMEALREMLAAAIQVLKPGGRLVVITYHSLEDRMVKNMIKAGNPEGRVEQDFFGRTVAPLSPLGKPITPSAEEQKVNPRSRSAKLRVGVKREY